MKNNHKIAVSASVVILTLISMGSAMGLFDIGKVCLFSEVNAVVTMNGKPVQGVEVIRTVNWANKDNSYTDKTSTNEKGEFHFDALFENSLSKFSLSSPVIAQNITFKLNGTEYIGWKTTKMNYDPNTEVGKDKSIILKCELTNESEIKDPPQGSPIVGICRW